MNVHSYPLILLSALFFAVEITAFQSMAPTQFFKANRMMTAGRLDASALTPQSSKGHVQRRASLHPLRMSSAVAGEVDVEAVTIESLYTCPVCKSAIELSDPACTNCGTAITSLPVSGATDLVKKEKEQSTDTSSSSSSSSCSLLKPLQDALGNNPLVNVGLGQLGFEVDGKPVRQELFRTPQVANAYERGWRASFATAGFPGIEKEYDLVMDYFQDMRGKTVLDLSCGSGLMVRRLARSNAYDKVIALDFSESMLEEVSRRKVEESCPDFDIIRGDVQAMPFKDGALDAIHSGAALHCWPSVEKGLEEVYRTLKPGGRFFATTFLWGVPDEELEGLMYDAGFDDYTVEKRRNCAIIRCRKQPAPESEKA